MFINNINEKGDKKLISKIENLKRIAKTGIVAVVRAENPDQALKIAEAVRAGGI